MARSDSVRVEKLNRREFLYYALGGSIVLAAGGAAAGLLRYMTPPENPETMRFVTLKSSELPPLYSAQMYLRNRFYIAHDEDKLAAFSPVCPFEGCLLDWIKIDTRFQCPCHGSRFKIDGTYIEGPTKRGLDRYFTEIKFADGTTATSNETGDPIPLLGREIVRVTVDTGRLILGPPRQ